MTNKKIIDSMVYADYKNKIFFGKGKASDFKKEVEKE